MSNFTTFFRTSACVLALSGAFYAYSDEQGSLDIQISDVTSDNAFMQITPNPGDLRYFWECKTKADFEAAGGVEKAVENRIAVWERMAPTWDEPNWQSLLKYVLYEGPQYENLNEWYTLLYDEDYVVYAFAMDLEGNLTVPVTTQEFHTLNAGTPSDNTFDITVTSIVKGSFYLTATAEIVPSNDDTYMARIYTKDFLDKYDLTAGSADAKKFACEEMLYQLEDDEILSGIASVQNARCREGLEYGVVVMGLDENKMPSTPLSVAYFTAVEEEKPELGTITLEVSDITPMNAHIKITPSSDEYRYYYYITTPEVIENKADGDMNNIPEKLIIDWWKYLGELYDIDWTEFIVPQTVTGSIDAMVSDLVEAGDLEDIYWNTEYVLYAVGFNEEGDVMTEPAVLYFTTPDVEETPDLTFRFGIVDIQLDPNYNNTGKKKYYEVTLEVDPSDDDLPYRFNYMQTKFYDQYLEDDEPDWMHFITRNFYPYSYEVKGWSYFKCQAVQGTNALGEELEYYAIAMGWNEGPTTEPFLYKFNPTQAYEESGVESVAGECVKVVAAAGKIYLTGDYEHAAVYATDGRVMGACRPGSTVAVPEGIYLVKYVDANGVSATKKVLVKE